MLANLRHTKIMQNRYVGDIGDFIKLALLRVLQPGQRLGIAWWLFPDEEHNRDGRHVSYLQRPAEWRALDPVLFDGLKQIVTSGTRHISALQNPSLLPNTVFCDGIIPTGHIPAQRRVNRAIWFETVQTKLHDCDLVFVDPDNGLETSSFSLGAINAGKCVSLAQLRGLSRPGRTLVVYHHQTRRKGGNIAELAYWADKLRSEGFQTVDAVRSRPFSPRAFFLLDAPSELRKRASRFSAQWGQWLSWHPDRVIDPNTDMGNS